MATLQSVGVQVTETDLTPVTQPVSASIGAYVGHFNWGPALELTNVVSETVLGKIFGTPSKKDDLTSGSFLTAESFLKYGNSLKVIRTVDTATAKNAKGEVYLYGTSEETRCIPNKTAFDIASSTVLTCPFYARYSGALGNSLSLRVFHANNTSTTATESKKFFSALASTTLWATSDETAATYVSETPITNDEVHIAIYDELGLISGTKGTVLETWEGLSLAPDARASSGANNYWADVINTGSSYVYVGNANDVATLSNDTYTLVGNGAITFTSGANGDQDYNNVVTTLSLLEDTDNIDVNLIFAEAFESDTQAEINDALIGIAEQRKDSMVFLSAPLGLYKLPSDSAKLASLQNFRNDLTANSSNSVLSYTVFDSTPVYVYNKYADRYEWIPACGHMAGLCAYTDEIADPWFSPAGFNRGQLRGVTKLAYNPKSTDRDDLYNSNINPIVNVPGQGIILYGDKTGQKRPTAFDRINVRRLFITIQRVIASAAKYQLFELNDEFTRNAFINIVDPYLRDVQGRRGITEYKVVCDETNNTPQVIDTNRFVADIYIKPARSINFISLNFIATRTGVSFTEIGA
jgi:phage tail sheath protein FI